MTAIKYALFALIAIAANLLVQYLSFLFYDRFGALYVAMAFGTCAGLITKYVLDKRYIFGFEADNHAHDVQRFFLYSMTGVLTTALFWGLEILSDSVFDHAAAKYLGGLLGLVIGYYCKYHLDKQFVFRRSAV